MKLNNLDDFLKKMNAQWQDKTCPICRAKNWQIEEGAYELREFQGGNLVLGNGSIIPVVPIMCRNCGYTILFNAIVNGLVKNKQNDEKGDGNEQTV
ncbi:hypothetical protein [Hallerella porci]|uniref:Uncharacterized protein n=1 Tax=Hallerella porci TaxID=1945871 RepID=A0ABX5LP87_9BACT|nr:hypothetical protein [Hallerella porci]PWK98196.1 hypothetical protein B0H50_1143 [Hallerella porci]